MPRNRELLTVSVLPSDRALLAELGREMKTSSATAIVRRALLDAAQFRGLVLVQGTELKEPEAKTP